MSTAGEQCRKSQQENYTFYFWGHALSPHPYVNLLDYIPHKATAVPLFLALRVSRRIGRASHQSILPAVCWRPGRPPAPPRILSEFRVQSSIRPSAPAVRRHLHSSNPVTRVESYTFHFSGHSAMQGLIGFGTNKYGTHVESIDGNCVLRQILWGLGAIWTAGNAIGFVRPEIAEGLRQDGNVAESLHPVRSIP